MIKRFLTSDANIFIIRLKRNYNQKSPPIRTITQDRACITAYSSNSGSFRAPLSPLTARVRVTRSVKNKQIFSVPFLFFVPRHTTTMKLTVVIALLAVLSVLCVASAQFSGRSESELFSKLVRIRVYRRRERHINYYYHTDEFQLFTKTYNKQYKTVEEAQLRFANFKVMI